MLLSLLAPEVGRDLAPFARSPFQYWVRITVLVQPIDRVVHEPKQRGIGGRASKRRIHGAVAYPPERHFRVAIDRAIAPGSLQPIQCVHDGQELADVDRSLGKWPLVKQLLAASSIDRLELQFARIPAARGIDRDAL